MQSSPARTRLLTVLLLFVVFGSGFILGLAFDRTAVATPAADAQTVAEADEPRRTPMYEQVGPSEDQSVLIDSIVTVHRAKMEALQEQFRTTYNPRYEALIDSTRESIKDVFSAEQSDRYDSLIAEYEKRKAERDARDAGTGRD